MSLTYLVAHYGYLAVFVGATLEGETILVMAGFAEGYLSFPLLFNLIGAAIWAPLIAGAGFLFGESLQWLFADIKRYEEAALLLVVAIAVALGLLRRLRRHS